MIGAEPFPAHHATIEVRFSLGGGAVPAASFVGSGHVNFFRRSTVQYTSRRLAIGDMAV